MRCDPNPQTPNPPIPPCHSPAGHESGSPKLDRQLKCVNIKAQAECGNDEADHYAHSDHYYYRESNESRPPINSSTKVGKCQHYESPLQNIENDCERFRKDGFVASLVISNQTCVRKHDLR